MENMNNNINGSNAASFNSTGSTGLKGMLATTQGKVIAGLLIGTVLIGSAVTTAILINQDSDSIDENEETALVATPTPTVEEDLNVNGEPQESTTTPTQQPTDIPQNTDTNSTLRLVDVTDSIEQAPNDGVSSVFEIYNGDQKIKTVTLDNISVDRYMNRPVIDSNKVYYIDNNTIKSMTSGGMEETVYTLPQGYSEFEGFYVSNGKLSLTSIEDKFKNAGFEQCKTRNDRLIIDGEEITRSKNPNSKYLTDFGDEYQRYVIRSVNDKYAIFGQVQICGGAGADSLNVLTLDKNSLNTVKVFESSTIEYIDSQVMIISKTTIVGSQFKTEHFRVNLNTLEEEMININNDDLIDLSNEYLNKKI